MREAIVEIIRKAKESAEERDILINTLHEIQKRFENFIPPEAAEIVSEELNVPLSKVYEVLTFYTMFSTKPKGKYVIRVCESLPCHVENGREVVKALKETLKIDFGQTTPDNMFTLEMTSCLGLCGVAPVIMVNDEYYGNMTPEKVKNLINRLRGEENETDHRSRFGGLQQCSDGGASLSQLPERSGQRSQSIGFCGCAGNGKHGSLS